MQFEAVALAGGKLTKDLLTPTDVFLVHSNKLYLWVGSSAPLAKKREATANAVKYITSVCLSLARLLGLTPAGGSAKKHAAGARGAGRRDQRLQVGVQQLGRRVQP